MHSPLRPSGETAWITLNPDSAIEIVKINPGGHEVTRYPGRVVTNLMPGQWLVAEAEWSRPELEISGLQFVPGDRLLEYFSPVHGFDAFAVFSPQRALRGWYANVTWPSWMAVRDIPTVYWHDLYVDLIGLPDGSFVVLDEDELANATLADDVRRMIGTSRDELIRRFQSRELPFTDR